MVEALILDQAAKRRLNNTRLPIIIKNRPVVLPPPVLPLELVLDEDELVLDEDELLLDEDEVLEELLDVDELLDEDELLLDEELLDEVPLRRLHK